MGNTLSSSTSPAASPPASSIPDEPKAKEPEPLPKPEENVKPANYREAFQGRHSTSQFIDPCEKAAKASMECMNRNNYDRDQCLDYFQAYRDCKSAWIEQRKQDRRDGRPTK